MEKEIRDFLVNAGYDVDAMLAATYDTKDEQGNWIKAPLYSDFRFVCNSIVAYEVCADETSGYTVEVRADGAESHCGYGRGCFWTDWEGGEED